MKIKYIGRKKSFPQFVPQKGDKPIKFTEGVATVEDKLGAALIHRFPRTFADVSEPETKTGK
jgi:hypothetical protein